MSGELDTFDYIVVGAGAAGCVLANRLSADSDRTVLLLEAGGSDEFFSQTRFTDLESLFALWGPETDWGFNTESVPGLNGRSIPITQGKVLGGGSSTNGRTYIRGNRRNYDSWAAAGNDGWSYRDVLPYFRRSENYAGGADEYHGADGPLPIVDLPEPTSIAQAFVRSAVSAGYKGPVDVNAADQDNVVSYSQSATLLPELARASAAVAFVHPIMDRPNFTLRTRSMTTRVILEGKRAVGVEYVDDGGTVRQARAAREVIVSAGAFNTPKLLMLSGIGPADQLRSHGIDVAANLPGVGENLQDHLLARLVWHLTEKQSKLMLLSEVNLFAYSNGDILDEVSPDLEFQFAPFFFPEYGPIDAGITLVPTLSQPVSRGTVRLRSANPDDAPLIQPNYLSEQSEVDVLLRGMEIGREIMASPFLDGMRGSEVAPGADVTSKADVTKYIRDTAFTVWHPSCTARMGNDAMAVVDPQLRVHGMDGLRVIDCSVMPNIVNSNLHATILMIAEKGADLVMSSS